MMILFLFVFVVLVPYSHCGAEDSLLPGETGSAWHGTLERPVFSSIGCCSYFASHADADHLHFLVRAAVASSFSLSKYSASASPVTAIVTETAPFRAGPASLSVIPESAAYYSILFSRTVSGLSPPVV